MNDYNESLALDSSDERKLWRAVGRTEHDFLGFEVSSTESFEQAAEAVRVVKNLQKQVEEYWEPLRVGSKASYDNVLAKKKEMVDPLKNVEKILKRKMADYALLTEKERKEQENAIKLRMSEECEKKMKEAVEAQNSGNSVLAEYAMAEAEILDSAITSAYVKDRTPSAKGVSVQKSWKIVSIDSSEVPTSLNGMDIRPVDEKAIMQLIKSSKGKIVIPGIKYEADATITIR